MSTNPPKEKQKEKVKLHEVCADCGKVKDKGAGHSVTAWIFGFHGCECKEKNASVSNGALVPSAIEKDEPLVGHQKNKDLNVDLGDQYEVIEAIGHGGMGTVYRVKDKVLGKEFAIKVLRKELAADESSVKRFEQEAKVASELTHVNVLAVYSNDRTVSGAPYIVMDYLEGESLAQLLQRESTLDPVRVANLSGQICSALAHAHMKGLIHRDLKPSNVMLTRGDAGADVVKVLDFGIAKVLPSANRETQNLTNTGELFGTPSYLSPEQCLGCNLDIRSDIYSLGCVMYEMLTGRPPFAGGNPIQTIVKHLNEQPLPINAIAPDLDVPAGLESIIMRCLEKEPADRYQSMDHLRGDLELVATGQKPKQLQKLAFKPIPVTTLLVLTVALLGIQISFFVLSCLHPILAAIMSEEMAKQIHLATIYHAAKFCVNVLVLLCAGQWLFTIGNFGWKQIQTKRKTHSAVHELWSIATLDFLAIGSVLYAVSLTSFFNGFFTPVAMSCSAVAMCSMLLAFFSSLAWIFTKTTSVITGRPAIRRKLKVASKIVRSTVFRRTFIIVSLLVTGTILMMLRPQLAWIPYSKGEIPHTGAYDVSEREERPTHTDSACDAAIFINPDFVEAHFDRGLSRLVAGRADSMDDFSKVISLHPGKPLETKALRHRAKQYFLSHDYEKAINDLSAIIKLDPDTGKGATVGPGEDDYYNRGLCFELTKQYQNALADYNHALVFRPSHSCAYLGRAKTCEQLGNNQQALSDYATALRASPGNLQIYVDRAALYKKLGETQKATEDYKTILKKFEGISVSKSESIRLPYNPYRCAAVAQQKLGMQTEAKDNQAKAIEYDKLRASQIKNMDERHYFVI